VKKSGVGLMPEGRHYLDMPKKVPTISRDLNEIPTIVDRRSKIRAGEVLEGNLEGREASEDELQNGQDEILDYHLLVLLGAQLTSIHMARDLVIDLPNQGLVTVIPPCPSRDPRSQNLAIPAQTTDDPWIEIRSSTNQRLQTAT
jgi:hypothetical protein